MLCGTKMFLILDFKLDRIGKNQNTIKEIIIKTLNFNTMYNSICLPLKLDKKVMNHPKENNNIMETDDVFKKIAIALGLGCNAFPSGIKNIGLSF